MEKWLETGEKQENQIHPVQAMQELSSPGR
jgi:hypothetical protein